MKDYSKVMNLPEAEQNAYFEEEKKKILAAGGDAKTVYLYLQDYFNRSKEAYLAAFRSLPLDSGLKEFQVVHQGLNALSNLEFELKREIISADRVSEMAPAIIEDENLNI
jgi:hypothetical protein